VFSEWLNTPVRESWSYIERQGLSGQRRQLLSERIAQFGIDKLDCAHEWRPSVCDKQNDKANNWRCIQELTSEIPLPLI
jgi:hypothetical protein